ncbi:AzlC family ABC transporter permease [Pseudoroseicyclus aestuarii]|uniref:Putative branched-subunit amino acid permease n=1 Tax=Pseudoroseicyclus aestuarii TaxID=1795041 RepID=A0A318SS58_9RHOB|nr:AzlC family ABC transporter permease [Pseudoroseicyclus aestuarii]PYE84660.1 putative branched-subunit amino acid permease [Pseudoroseicyclus aestuarii]
MTDQPDTPTPPEAATPAARAFGHGLRDGLPFLLVLTPFALVFGVAAREAGLDVLQALAFSVAVVAGAAQFAALHLMLDEAPLAIILLTALAVNLRMAMYSAGLVPWLGQAPLWQRACVAYLTVDQTYACSVARFEKNPQWSTRTRILYFLGCATPVCPIWFVMTLVGAVIGSALPAWLALDFAMPICFLALIAPMLRSLPHLAAAATSILLSLGLAFLPYNTGVLVAALVAMAVGAQCEVWLKAHGPRRARAA